MERVQANGIELAYDSFGEGDPLVLVMGLAGPRRMWPEEWCLGLAEEGFRVIRYDHRDVGCSTWLQDAGTPDLPRLLVRRALGLPVRTAYTLSDLAADLVGLLDALEIDAAHVVGGSMGGMVGQTLAIEHPHRLRSLTSMLAGPGNRRFLLGKPHALRALLAPFPEPGPAAVDHEVALLRLLNGSALPVDEGELRQIVTEAQADQRHPDASARHLAAVLASGGRLRKLRSVTVPTLVINGTADPLVSVAAGRATARAIPGARLHLVEGMGHGLPRVAWPELIEAIASHARGTERAATVAA
ncbi:MAG: alpha/beta hydrolase [Deltaproteobacteria bacterium]|nr:alpha/beta hydrolase [Deltaproteobacteria bacterium]MBW2256097.1 alpha/beta hydrolase [Deltaproteobacteria bacterium]